MTATPNHSKARGSHIYIRPSGEHRYTALDDLSEISLAKLTADGFTPCAVVETSAGNFQAWLKHPAVFPKLLGTFAAQTLANRYDADPSAAKGDYESRTEWHRVYAWRNLSKFAKTLQKGQLVTLEGTLRYREVETDVDGTRFKHRIAEVHATSMKRLSKIEAADDPADGASEE